MVFFCQISDAFQWIFPFDKIEQVFHLTVTVTRTVIFSFSVVAKEIKELFKWTLFEMVHVNSIEKWFLIINLMGLMNIPIDQTQKESFHEKWLCNNVSKKTGERRHYSSLNNLFFFSSLIKILLSDTKFCWNKWHIINWHVNFWPKIAYVRDFFVNFLVRDNNPVL